MTQPDLFSLDTRSAGPDGLTADQASARVGLTPFSGRPRVTELYQGGFLETTGERRRNRSGKPARVLRSVKP